MAVVQKMVAALGTLNGITIWCERAQCTLAEEALGRIEAYLLESDDRLSVFKPNSEISCINAAAGQQAVAVSKETFELICLARQYSEQSGGAFDMTADKSGKSRCKGNFLDIETDTCRQTVKLAKAGMRMDAGGIAKGFAADKIRAILAQYDFRQVLINLGGTVYNAGEPRRIGIRNPFLPRNENHKESAFATLRSSGEMVVTSGLYEQKAHIINPATGNFVQSNLLSVTAIGASGAQADAFATAVFVLGIERGMMLLHRHHMKAVVVLKDGAVYADALLEKQEFEVNYEK